MKLGELGYLVMLALEQTPADERFGLSIHETVVKLSQRRITHQVVYTTLRRLEEKKILKASKGKPTAKQGGRAKRLFTTTAAGARLLRAQYDVHRRMEKGLRW